MERVRARAGSSKVAELSGALRSRHCAAVCALATTGSEEEIDERQMCPCLG